jgi:hypothetical protein
VAKKCQFRKKNGNACGADAQSGETLCVFHDPAKAISGRRARRAGGLSRTRTTSVLPAGTPDHPLGNCQDVSDLLGDSINRLRRGELLPEGSRSGSRPKSRLSESAQRRGLGRGLLSCPSRTKMAAPVCFSARGAKSPKLPSSRSPRKPARCV